MRACLSVGPAWELSPTDQLPQILLLYGSLHEQSYSRPCIEEAARLRQRMGCDIRIIDPSDLPWRARPARTATANLSASTMALNDCDTRRWVRRS